MADKVDQDELCRALLLGNADMVSHALAAGVAPDAQFAIVDESGKSKLKSLLSFATEAKQLALVRLLMQRGAKIDNRTNRWSAEGEEEDEVPLSIACQVCFILFKLINKTILT